MGGEPQGHSNGAPPSSPRTRRVLSRTLSRDRFRDYQGLLRAALSLDYRVVALEDFLFDPAARTGDRILILRHDVDQHPASALAAADIERRLGVRSTWYLRWRTADPGVVSALRAAGGTIGLHYETLTRRVLAERLAPGTDLTPLLPGAREELREEVRAFQDAFGPVRSLCAHGDSRVPWARNLTLLEGEDPADFGVRADANLEMRRHALAVWLTDRSAAEGSWNDGHDPLALLQAGCSPIQCLIHPNNWVSGAALWRDRLLAGVLPEPAPGRSARLPRTRGDRPAVLAP